MKKQTFFLLIFSIVFFFTSRGELLAADCIEAAKLSKQASRYTNSSPNRAVKRLRQAVSLCADSASLHYNLAIALYSAGRLASSESELIKTLNLNPDYANALNALAFITLERKGDTDRAVELARKAVSIEPRNAEFRDTLQQAKAKIDKTPPTITITKPLDDKRALKKTVREGRLSLEGIVRDRSGIAEVTVNGMAVVLADNGFFTAELLLKMDKNIIRIRARDKKNNIATKNLTIVRKEAVKKFDFVKAALGKYYALIIGNNNYRYMPKLKTARNDAKEVAKLLKREYGFETKLLLDANRSKILGAINDARRRLKENDSFLIYYAGHGEFDEMAQKAYWLPVDARPDDDTNWIIADAITSNIKRVSSNHILVVADSCYSGTLTRRGITDLSGSQARVRYMRKMLKKNSRTLLASGGNEPVSDAGGEGHSVFAAAFIDGLKSMEQEVFTAEEIFFEYIKERVAGSAEQIPEYNTIRNSGHEGGDFIFIHKQKGKKR